MNVLYGCDDNYAPYTGVSMTSLFENNKAEDSINVYLAAVNISESNILLLKGTAQKYNRNLVILDTNQAIAQITEYKCNTWNGSLATWLRFFVLEQIPDDVEKLLWLDSDTIINGSLSELFQTDIEDFPICAAFDSICYRERFRLGLTENQPYFNAGVILFNLKLWRQDALLDKMMNHLRIHVQNYAANDQDLLNDYFRGQIKVISNRFNFQGIHLAYSPKQYFRSYKWLPGTYYTPEEVVYAEQNKIVIHYFRFLGDYPWVKGNIHPARSYYLKYKAISPWADEKDIVKHRAPVFIAERFLYRILPRGVFLAIFQAYTNRNCPKSPL